ncbi:b6b2e5fa-6476-445c-adbd-fbbda463b2a1 [Thermothielavioides terrestris]|nr:b6b2e5fa-6476-445c-adbd-fbbda463b2a1 [Thermothielavioides terrestris]
MSIQTEDSSGSPASHPHPHRQQLGDRRQSPAHKRAPCPEFPAASPDQLYVAEAELFGHIYRVPGRAIEDIRAFYYRERECDSCRFISTELLHAFVELYLEYFDPKFPFLHPSRLRDDNLPWILLTAVAAVGSQYSEVRDACEYGLVLRELLDRAIKIHIPPRSKWTGPFLPQSLFLRHVLHFFAGTKMGLVTSQFERSALVSGLRALTSHHERGECVDRAVTQKPHDEWQAWLSAESNRRLIYCVHALECLGYVFLDQPPLFNITDFVHEPPCDPALWQCQSAEEWRSKFTGGSGTAARQRVLDPVRDSREDSLLGVTATSSPPDHFRRRIRVLELYVDDRLRSRQSRSSRMLRSIFSNPGEPDDERAGPLPPSSVPLSPRDSPDERSFVDETIDTEAYTHLGSRHPTTDLVVHVLAILRLVPLATLYRATGWQTDQAGMARAKAHMGRFFHRDRAGARKCLWHAAVIFSELRNARRFACYDALNLCVSVCYIWLYAHLAPGPPRDRDRDRSQQPEGASPSAPQQRGTVIGLDKLAERRDVEKWIASGAEAEIYITGVGRLRGPNSQAILLGDATKTLMNQAAWRPLCRGLARAFTQLKRGELPDLGPEEGGEN